ncbi:MAG: BON domain-containing protein [Cupriavidus sp.]|nr:BON domain-containing protein [Cupriavidus sp.]
MKGDIQLKQDVIEELNWDPAVDATGIGVQVNDGVVTLTGHLASLAEKYAAEAAVKRIPGVNALAVELDVRLPDDCQRTDADIARAAANVLGWNAMIPNDRISIMVEHGAVTLTGTVDWNYQRMEAEHAVAGLFGVTGVANAIVVRPQADRRELSLLIKSAIERQATCDASQVTVMVWGGAVTLGGSLRTWAEREAAVNAAWSAPGVTSVNNNIRVNP